MKGQRAKGACHRQAAPMLSCESSHRARRRPGPPESILFISSTRRVAAIMHLRNIRAPRQPQPTRYSQRSLKPFRS